MIKGHIPNSIESISGLCFIARMSNSGRHEKINSKIVKTCKIHLYPGKPEINIAIHTLFGVGTVTFLFSKKEKKEQMGTLGTKVPSSSPGVYAHIKCT